MRTRRLGRPPLLAGLLAVAVAVGALIAFIALRSSFRAADERAFDRRATGVPVRLEGEIDRAVFASRAVAVALERGPADDAALARMARLLNDEPAVLGAAMVPADDPALRATASVGREALGGLDPAATTRAREVARDTGEPAATGPLRPGRVGLLVARYRDPDAPDVVARRASLEGWLVFTVDTDRLLRVALPQTPPGLLRVVVTDDGRVVARTSPAPSTHLPTRTTDVSFKGRTWRFLSGPDDAFGSKALAPWIVLAAGWALALAGLAVTLAVRGTSQRAEAVAEARTREIRLIAGLGPMLQESLDVADLVPSFAVSLADEFDLDRLVVSVADDGGALQQAFAMGSRSGPTVADVPPPAKGIAAGAAFALPLQRAGRSVGRLELRSRSALEPSAVDALRAVADLLAAALGNAQAFAREQETVRRLQDVDQLKNDFVSTVTHELRTTVTAIAGFGDVLAQHWDQLDDQRRRDFVDRITRNSATLRLLVDGMLDFARLDRSALALSTEPVQLDAVVSAQVEQMSSLLDRHVVRLDAAPGTTALGEPAAIERIVANLLSNAAKYAPPGTAITVEVRPDGDRALVSVTDEGPGIGAEDREHVFTRFYRGDSDAARQTRGAGVGLAVVAELVERLGATVAIESGPTGGARFVVRFALPAEVAQ